MGPISGVYAGDILLNALLAQHARHRLRGVCGTHRLQDGTGFAALLDRIETNGA